MSIKKNFKQLITSIEVIRESLYFEDADVTESIYVKWNEESDQYNKYQT
jgi:hypothetical protein